MTLGSLQNNNAVSVVGVTETVVCGPMLFQAGRDITLIVLFAEVLLTTGSDAANISISIRRGLDATGALVGLAWTQTIFGPAGSTNSYTATVIDTQNGLADANYVVTVTQAGGVANGATVQANLTAIAR